MVGNPYFFILRPPRTKTICSERDHVTNQAYKWLFLYNKIQNTL